MKIAVLIASRGRPLRLRIALQRIVDTADRPHNIRIGVWLDDDDGSGSENVVNEFAGCQVTLMQGPRPSSLGAAHNALAGVLHADLYCVLADDVYPADRGWDTMLEAVHAKLGDDIYCWQHRSTDPAYPIISRRWLEAAGGIFTADLFPYWFDDFWLAEVAELVTGDGIGCIKPLRLTGDKGSGTPRMRELRHWYSVFHATRPLRVAEAEEIYAKLYGMPLCCETQRAEKLADLASGDDRRMNNADRWEEEYSTAVGEPDAAYVAAKAKAADVVARLSAGYDLC